MHCKIWKELLAPFTFFFGGGGGGTPNFPIKSYGSIQSLCCLPFLTSSTSSSPAWLHVHLCLSSRHSQLQQPFLDTCYDMLFKWTCAHWDYLIYPVINLVCLLGSGRPADCKSVHFKYMSLLYMYSQPSVILSSFILNLCYTDRISRNGHAFTIALAEKLLYGKHFWILKVLDKWGLTV